MSKLYPHRKITRNAIRCLKCSTVIESTHVHHFIRCECKAVFADGGLEYLRRGWSGGEQEEAFEELSEYEPGDEVLP